MELQLKARTLWKALETPRETMVRHSWAQVCLKLQALVPPVANSKVAWRHVCSDCWHP